MIQDIAPHQLFNQYRPSAKPTEDSIILWIDGNNVLVHEDDGAITLSTFSECPSTLETIYLFSIDQTAYYLSRNAQGVPENLSWVSIQTLRENRQFPQHQLFAVMTAKHLADWYRDNQFCGRCGSSFHHSETERCMVCESCKNRNYPRIMPAVIVGVINGDELLITRYRNGYRHNALIAGFTEIGETAEETVAREVLEESGLHVKNIRYYKSQPWGIANDLLLGYYCEVDGDPTIRMDESELRYAQWTRREDIVLQPDDISLTNEMMREFQAGRQ